MKLKINKACDLGSISVLPPRSSRTGGSGGAGASGSSAVAAVGSQQQRSQPLSQQSFAQGGGSSGGASSLLLSQSQFSQGSLDENLLALHLISPSRDQLQRTGLHDGSSKKVHSLPARSASAVPEESQLQLAKISGNPVHRWNPPFSDSRYQVPNEDVERKFQHLASSVHKMGMVLDSVQNDCMQLNRAMKEASLENGSIQQKIVLLDNSIQKILKGEDDLKALVESSTKSNSDQLEVISSALSVWQKQMQADLKQQQSDIFRILREEMEAVVRAIRSLSSRPALMQMPADQSCISNERLLMNQQPAGNERCPVNQTPVATLVTQAPVANIRPMVTQTPVASGRSLMSQMPAANAEALMTQTSVANGRPLVSQIPAANGNPQTCQKPVASGRRHANQVPAPKVNAAPLACPARLADPELKIELGRTTVALPQKLAGSGTRVIPKQEPVPITRVNRQASTKKVPPIMIIIDSDDDSDGRASCVILKTRTETGGNMVEESLETMKEATKESLQILRRARKRRRREMLALVPTT